MTITICWRCVFALYRRCNSRDRSLLIRYLFKACSLFYSNTIFLYNRLSWVLSFMLSLFNCSVDLTFATSSLVQSGLHTKIATYLDSTSDHKPILTIISWDQRSALTAPKMRFDTLDQRLFLSLLSINITQAQPFDSTKGDLEKLAYGLIAAIHNAYKGSAKRSLPP